MRLIFIFHLLLVINSCAASDNVQTRSIDNVPYVSLTNLIVHPEHVDEPQVLSVSGFLVPVGQLFLSEAHATTNDLASVVYVAFPEDGFFPEDCVDRFVRVTGLVERNRAGDIQMTSIYRIEVPVERPFMKDCWRIGATKNKK